MKKLIESMTGGYSSTASIVDGTLILTLPDALSPVVWRMDLGQAKSSALEVRTNDDGTYTLALKTPRGDVTDIAPFAAKAAAVRAMMAVSSAMERAHGQIRPLLPPPASASTYDSAAQQQPVQQAVFRPSGGGRSGKLVTALIAVLLLGGILIMLAVMGTRGGAYNPELAGSQISTIPGAAAGASPRPGVPVSADDFLRSR